ncbi:PDZ domain-containing protein [Sphingomonas ginkgonis]|nr:PDZ domain-containing protein [Sphingomonas ginkgonis]
MPTERGFPFAWLVVGASLVILLVLVCAVSLSGPLHLLQQGQPQTALGMTLSQGDRQGGVLVTSLQQRGPAERGGIEVGDRIISVDHRPAMSAAAVGDAVRSSPSNMIHLQVMHDGREHVVQLSRQGSPHES